MPDSRRAVIRRRTAVLVVLGALALSAAILIPGPRAGGRGDGRAVPATKRSTIEPARREPARPDATSLCPCPNLAAGSDPSVLPAPVLIADHMNNRLLIVDPNGTIKWLFPGSGDLAPGQSFLVPDDAFFTPDGQNIVVTEEDDFVIRMVSVAQHRILWTYGTPGIPGSGPNQLWNPDDAMMQPNGTIIAADIKNCRIVLLRPGAVQPIKVYGATTTACRHDPPQHWGSPNGAFPMTNGHYLVTEINGDWVDELTLAGQVVFSTHPPGVGYPSDSNEVRPGVYLTVDYSTPGEIEEFNQQGQTLWRFKPVGPNALNQPSLALPLPNGDIIANDDYNHRVIVVDPRTNRIVWQYGHTGQSGSAPGYLNVPDGLDLLPPLSLTQVHAGTMGQYSLPFVNAG